MFIKKRCTAHSPEPGFVLWKASNRPRTALRSFWQDRTSCQHLPAPLSQRSCSLRSRLCRRMSPSRRQSPRLWMGRLQEGLTHGNHRKQSWKSLGNTLQLIRLPQGRISYACVTSDTPSQPLLAFSWSFGSYSCSVTYYCFLCQYHTSFTMTQEYQRKVDFSGFLFFLHGEECPW